MNERKTEFKNYRISLDNKTDFADKNNNVINQKIKSIVIGRFSNPSLYVIAKFKEGDIVVLWPGRVVNLKEASQGVSLSWEGYTGEWIDIDISEDEPLVGFTPPQGATLVSNVAVKRVCSTVDMYWMGYGSGQTKLIDANPNRIKLDIEIFGFARIYIGNYEQTKDAVSVDLREVECSAIMPFCKVTLQSSEELWAITDENFLSMYWAGVSPNGLTVKLTEYLK